MNDLSYEAIAGFTRTWGLIYFFVVFAAVVVYAYLPRNKHKFDEAARVVFRDEENDYDEA